MLRVVAARDARDAPSLALIGEQRLIGFRSCRSTSWVESQLRAAGHEPNFVFRSEDNGTVQAMAGAGLGSALVPLLAVDTSDPTDRVMPTALEPRRIALMWHRDRYRSPASRAFVEIAQDVCADARTGLGDLARRDAARPRRRPSRPRLTADAAFAGGGIRTGPLVYSAGARQPVS